jgi:hypothetical protein
MAAIQRPISDMELRSRVRGVLTRLWIDLQTLDLGCYRGAVRLRGELRHSGKLACQPVEAGAIELLETELRRLRGVRQVLLHVANWRRNDSGQWELANKTRLRLRGPEAEDRGVWNVSGNTDEAEDAPAA